MTKEAQFKQFTFSHTIKLNFRYETPECSFWFSIVKDAT